MRTQSGASRKARLQQRTWRQHKHPGHHHERDMGVHQAREGKMGEIARTVIDEAVCVMRLQCWMRLRRYVCRHARAVVAPMVVVRVSPH
jgi:hypothetical protein